MRIFYKKNLGFHYKLESFNVLGALQDCIADRLYTQKQTTVWISGFLQETGVPTQIAILRCSECLAILHSGQAVYMIPKTDDCLIVRFFYKKPAFQPKLQSFDVLSHKCLASCIRDSKNRRLFEYQDFLLETGVPMCCALQDCIAKKLNTCFWEKNKRQVLNMRTFFTRNWQIAILRYAECLACLRSWQAVLCL